MVVWVCEYGCRFYLFVWFVLMSGGFGFVFLGRLVFGFCLILLVFLGVGFGVFFDFLLLVWEFFLVLVLFF